MTSRMQSLHLSQEQSGPRTKEVSVLHDLHQMMAHKSKSTLPRIPPNLTDGWSLIYTAK